MDLDRGNLWVKYLSYLSGFMCVSSFKYNWKYKNVFVKSCCFIEPFQRKTFDLSPPKPELPRRSMARVISWEEVEQHHGDADTVWTVIRGRVYDMTRFLDEHPGGAEILKENAGLDSTEQFDDVGHSSDAHEMLQDYEIGRVEGEDEETSAPANSWTVLWIPVACAVLAGILVLKLTVLRK